MLAYNRVAYLKSMNCVILFCIERFSAETLTPRYALCTNSDIDQATWRQASLPSS